ncbi:unnamed protein product [Discula destructiva]
MANTSSPSVASWFPSSKDNWQLDAVTLLAVIGEASVSDNAQPMTASLLCCLPRILPAPQALLKPTRPTRLPAYKAQLVGVHSGVCLDSVSFFANIIHPLEEKRAHSFSVYKIWHRDEAARGEPKATRNPRTWSHKLLPGTTAEAKAREKAARRIPGPPSCNEEAQGNNGRTVAFEDVEMGKRDPLPDPIPGIIRRRTNLEKVQDFVTDPSIKPSDSLPRQERPAVPPALGSPIHIITIFSFLLTLVIFGLTAYWQDGNALLATMIISLQASLVGYASWWRPRMMCRPHSSDVPPADMVIRTREGAFILVKCTEEVARELYTGTEECEYHLGPTGYRICMALGTMSLMVGVVLLGNTKFNAQALISGSYILLNGAYWLLGLLPKKHFWDLSRYDWEEVTPIDARDADHNDDSNVELQSSFTRTLWYAIRETREIGWVVRSDAAPGTPQWKKWLEEALKNAKAGNRKWTAVTRKDEIMKQGVMESAWPATSSAEQHAPYREVPTNTPTGPLVADSL